MRTRLALASAVMGAALLTGGTAAVAQATPAPVHATDTPKAAAATWHYLDSYESRYLCDNAAEQLKQQNPSVYPQCRGPYDGGWFQLWYYA